LGGQIILCVLHNSGELTNLFERDRIEALRLRHPESGP